MLLPFGIHSFVILMIPCTNFVDGGCTAMQKTCLNSFFFCCCDVMHATFNVYEAFFFFFFWLLVLSILFSQYAILLSDVLFLS